MYSTSFAHWRCFYPQPHGCISRQSPALLCSSLSRAVAHFAALQVSSLELKTNLLAAYVSAGLSAQLPELMRQLGIKPRDSFEIAFNRCEADLQGQY
jgi:hypothetical protein